MENLNDDDDYIIKYIQRKEQEKEKQKLKN